MTNQTLEIFLHGKGPPKVVAAELNETLQAVLMRVDALPGEGQFVFVGEADEERVEDLDEDTHVPANLTLTLEQLCFKKHTHVHTRTVHRVDVTVHFNGQRKHRFSPATTIAILTAWAKARFHLDPTSSSDLVLAIRPSGEHPRPDQHLGELLSPGSHAIVFDLVREITPQG